MSTLVQDLRVAIRSLRQRPSFAIVAVVTLALGIGANTAIFSVVNGVLLKPLPFPEPHQLVQVWQTNEEWMKSSNPRFAAFGRQFPLSFPVYNDWLELNPCFESVGIYAGGEFVSSSGDLPQIIETSRVTFGVLDSLGVPPVLGRTFRPEDDRIGGEALIVLGYGLWQNHFGGDPAIIGRTIPYNERPYMVIGIMPAGFSFPGNSTQAWVTFEDRHKQRGRGNQSYSALARLKPGLSIEMARRQMEAVNQQIVERTKGEHEFGVFLHSRLDQVVGETRPALLVLLAAVGAVLLIACANIANLLLVRATERRRELAIRSALGAGRGRLLRLLLTESLALSLLGGSAGILVAWAGFKPMLALLPSSLPRLEAVSLDYRVLLFSAGISLLTGILVGALPTLGVNRLRITDALGDASRGFAGGRRRNRSQSVLVAVEIALAFTLLAGAGVLVKSFSRLTSVERGFDSANLLTLRVGLRGSRYAGRQARDSYFQQLTQRLLALPGVQGVGRANSMPFSGGTSSGSTSVETPQGIQATNFERSSVSHGYFSSMGIPLLAGREFSPADSRDAPAVTIISQAAAGELWPHASPLGWRIKRGSPDGGTPWLTIVGVAKDVRHRGLHVAPPAKMYQPLAQRPSSAQTMVVKAMGDPGLLAAVVRDTARQLDPQLPVPQAVLMERLVSRSVSMPRFRTLLMGLLAGLAALLAVVGIYGVLAYAVAQRTAEIGVRMALGARYGDLIRNVLGRGLALSGIGLAAGIGVSYFAVRTLQSFLYETQAEDPLTFIVAASLLAGSGILASYVPARRAAKVNPVEALRIE